MPNLYKLIAITFVLFLCANLSELKAADYDPAVGIDYWVPVMETDSASLHGIKITEFINGSARLPKYDFSFQRWDDPQLDELKARLGIDELIADAGSEFEAAARIAHKLCNMWAHSAPLEYPTWSALDILNRIDKGEQLWCTYKQLVTMQALAAIGIHSRIIPCAWHHSLEFWSNEYAKWVVMDAWTANYYHKDGIPLGALELHKYSQKNLTLKGSGVWEMNINPNRWKPDRTADSTLADSPCYRHIRYIPRNDFISAPLAHKGVETADGYTRPINQLADPLQTGLPHISWWDEGYSPTLIGRSVRYEEDFNFPLNEVEIMITRPVKMVGALDLEFSTHTPEFDTYLVRIDETEWRPAGSRLLWKLNEGTNKLEVKTRNKWGREGPHSLIELEYDPSVLKVEPVSSIEVPNAGFEEGDSEIGFGDVMGGNGWRMIVTDKYQEPAVHSMVEGNPHSGNRCVEVKLNAKGIWARLMSSRFRVNQASDLTMKVWLRADRNGREAAIFLNDRSTTALPTQGNIIKRVILSTEWRQYELKARVTAVTTHLSAGVQVMSGAVWADDFSVTEDRRKEVDW